jgi:hypothetical protein
MVWICTGRESELSAVHEVRCTDEVRSLDITIFKTTGVEEWLYGLVVGVSAPKVRQKFSSV